MTIVEPMTMATDYVLALAGLAFAARVSTRLWRAGFLVTALAAALGGTYHGFALHFSEAQLDLLWQATVWLIAAAAGSVTWAVFSGPLDRTGNVPWLAAGALLTAAGYALLLGGVSPHAHFNHNDLYHSIQTVALYLFFKGAE